MIQYHLNKDMHNCFKNIDAQRGRLKVRFLITQAILLRLREWWHESLHKDDKILVEYNLEPDTTHFGCIIVMLVKWRDSRWESPTTCVGWYSIIRRMRERIALDKTSANKIMKIFVRKGKSYMLDFPVYMHLERAA